MIDHEWDLTAAKAIELQRQLAKLVIRHDQFDQVHFVAGVDMALRAGMAHGAVVLLSYPGLEVVEKHTHTEPLRMPYIPGLLSFREAPSIIKVFDKLHQRPDLVLVDGSGIAHPRRLGLASHLGLWWDVPTIGCAKSLLTGSYDEQALGDQAGSWVPLVDKQEVIGAVVRTRTHVNPVFVSLGHRISLLTSITYILACCRGFRLPEPVRQADKLSKIR